MQENEKKDERENPTVSQKKDGWQAMVTRWKNKLFGIILLLILGFVANYFVGDSGQEVGQNNYPTEAAGVSVTPEVTQKDQPTPEPSGGLTKEQGTKDDVSGKDTEEEDGSKDDVSGKDTGEEDSDKEAVDATHEIEILYEFRRASYLEQHFEKHGAEFEYKTKEEYLEGANRVIQSPDALHKIEAEDGDDIYYIEETNEFVVVSTDGYIRTYFRPSAGIDYYNRQ